MIYKICLVRNRYHDKIDIKKYAIDWFKIYANLDVEINVVETDFDVTTQKVSNKTFSGVIVGADILQKLRTVIPENKYNAVVFTYGNLLNGIRVSSTNIDGTQPLYPDTEFIQVCKTDDNGRTVNHEMFHAFFIKAHKCEIDIVDNMDTYLRDSDLSVNNIIDTNREVALNTLKPFWGQICSFRGHIDTTPKLPVVTITRNPSTAKETIGILRTNDGLFGCDTLELPWLNNQKNISCIPVGTYTCKWTYSLKFPLGSYEVMNVPGRSGIRYHTGNFYKDIQGCILLGSLPKDTNNDGEVDLQNSGLIISAFNKYMGRKLFTLIIK